MRTVMLAHIDKFGGFFNSLERGLYHSLGLADKSDNGTVCGLSRIHIEQFHIGGISDTFGYGVDNGAIAALAEIGHTLYKAFFHTGMSIMIVR